MPWVYYPFPDDHEHAGKFYRGWMPAGDVEGMLERSGARLAEDVPDLGLSGRPPKSGLVVDESGVIRRDQKSALADWECVEQDLKSTGRASLSVGYSRTIRAAERKLAEALDGDDLVRARAELRRIEKACDEGRKRLAQSARTTLGAAGQEKGT